MSTTTTINWTLLEEAGEPLAAAYMQAQGASPLRRCCRALRRFFETCPLPAYQGETLYPCSDSLYTVPQVLRFHYSASLTVDWALLERKQAEASDPAVAAALGRLGEALRELPPVGGYTHSIINFGRVLAEGLGAYEQRVREHRQRAQAEGVAAQVDFYEALEELLAGLLALQQRCAAHLQSCPGGESLAAALARVPWEPARGFGEAMIATNFLYYVDGCDDLGRFDQDLWPYYRDDLAAGAVTREQASEQVSRIFRNLDHCAGWNVALGGTAADGSEGSNDLTLVCLEVSRGRRRPNLALRLRRDTPEAVWDQALETISGGSGIPALYNEEEYQRALRLADLGVAEEDLPHYAFGGCTELMIHGRSNVGSLDHTLNLGVSLEKALHQHLESSASFEAFLEQVKARISRDIETLTAEVNRNQETKAHHQPQPIRTLLVDDCIDNGQEFNAGGARYNWSVINVAGLPNTYDSLAAVREVVYERAEISAAELLAALRADYEGHEPLRRRLERCPRYGNDDPAVDDLAVAISTHTFQELMARTPWRGGRFLGSCLMFVTYGHFGAEVGATPDGRQARTPIADSAGAVQGRDRSGPTALLRSVAKAPHFLAPGTLVINIRFTRRLFNDPEARRQMRSLIETYFSLGGMQLQINVVDQQVLRDALKHPERYQDLIVRMGGYSEYFTRLDPGLQLTVLERTEHE